MALAIVLILAVAIIATGVREMRLEHRKLEAAHGDGRPAPPYRSIGFVTILMWFWSCFLILATAMGIGDSGYWRNLPKNAEMASSVFGCLATLSLPLFLVAPAFAIVAIFLREAPRWLPLVAIFGTTAPIIALLGNVGTTVAFVSRSSHPYRTEILGAGNELVPYLAGTLAIMLALVVFSLRRSWRVARAA